MGINMFELFLVVYLHLGFGYLLFEIAEAPDNSFERVCMTMPLRALWMSFVLVTLWPVYVIARF